MNENIDLTKILKDCPKGTKFYSSLFGEVEFDSILYNRITVVCVGLRRLVEFNRAGKYLIESSENNGTCFSSECLLFPSKEQRDWSKFTAPWYKKEKFDPKTLKPFDRIIVRNEYDEWKCTLFSHINPEPITRFICATCESFYIYCIPYNNETKHLLGTKEEAPEFYKYWED